MQTFNSFGELAAWQMAGGGMATFNPVASDTTCDPLKIATQVMTTNVVFTEHGRIIDPERYPDADVAITMLALTDIEENMKTVITPITAQINELVAEREKFVRAGEILFKHHKEKLQKQNSSIIIAAESLQHLNDSLPNTNRTDFGKY